jgi:transposase
MDNDTSQTSKAARKAIEKSDAEFHKIPATSSDLNPIENVFQLVKKSLENEAIANNLM